MGEFGKCWLFDYDFGFEFSAAGMEKIVMNVYFDGVYDSCNVKILNKIAILLPHSRFFVLIQFYCK